MFEAYLKYRVIGIVAKAVLLRIWINSAKKINIVERKWNCKTVLKNIICNQWIGCTSIISTLDDSLTLSFDTEWISEDQAIELPIQKLGEIK